MKTMEGKKTPNVLLKTRVRDTRIKGQNQFRWQDVKTSDMSDLSMRDFDSLVSP